MFLGSHFAAPIIGTMFLESQIKQIGNEPSFSTSKYLVLGLLGMMPDMLYPHFGGGSHYQSVAHTIWAFGLFALATLLISKIFFKNLTTRYMAYLILALSSHYFIDFFSGGIKWLYPFTESRIGYALIPLKTWVVMDFALIITMIVIMKIKTERSLLQRKNQCDYSGKKQFPNEIKGILNTQPKTKDGKCGPVYFTINNPDDFFVNGFRGNQR